MSEPFIGEIRMVGFNFAPRGWALCDGQLLAIAQNTALFSLLGTIYGGDGRTTFGLPDLRSRVPMHAGTGPGLTPRQLGAKFGLETVTLNVTQLPAHTHAAQASSGSGNANSPIGRIWSKDAGVQSATYTGNAPDGSMAANAIANAGGGQAHDNMPPVQVVNFVIALVGLYPSRN